MIPISEASFLTQVKALAYQYGWLVHHQAPMRTPRGNIITGGSPGYPDLCLAHEQKGVIFAELKTEKGKPSVAQLNWIRTLSPHAECYLWRPSMLPSIALRLSQAVRP